MRHLTITLAASNALMKWLKMDFPRMPSPDGQRIGTQPLVTNSDNIAWQCHVVQNFYRRGEYTAIAVEAYSRYTLLMPFTCAPSRDDFERLLRHRWITDLVQLMLESGALTEAQLQPVWDQFNRQVNTFSWYRNTDLSVNAHVSDADQWLKQALEHYRIDSLDEEQAFGLGMQVNKQRKRAKSAKGRFVPVARMVDDGLFRFADGLADFHYPDTRKGNFPNPYPVTVGPGLTATAKANVISLADYARRKRER